MVDDYHGCWQGYLSPAGIGCELELEGDAYGHLVPLVARAGFQQVEDDAVTADSTLCASSHSGVAIDNFHLGVEVVPAKQVEVEVYVDMFVEHIGDTGFDGAFEAGNLTRKRYYNVIKL